MRLQTPKTLKSFNIVRKQHLQHATPATTQDGLPTKPTDEQRLQDYFYSDAFVKLYLAYISKDSRAVLIRKTMANKNDRHEALTSFITIKLPKLDSHVTKWIDYIEADKVCYENEDHLLHRGYIMTALTNFLTNEWKKKSRYQKRLAELKEEHDASVEATQEATQLLEEIGSFVKTNFPKKDLDCFAYHAIGYKSAEIGKKLGICEQNVRFKLRRIFKALQATMELE